MQESKFNRLKNRAANQGYILHNAAYILETGKGRKLFSTLGEIEEFLDEGETQELRNFNAKNKNHFVATFAK